MYSRTEGYDTVAKSRGLKDSFIRDTLHNLCVYKPPTYLSDMEKKDKARYPEALTCIQAESGEMVFGKAFYLPLDFTGQRNTYFVHNFVIEGLYKEELIKDIRKVLNITCFDNRFLGNAQLPELEALTFDESYKKRSNLEYLFTKLKLNEHIFKSLIYCTMMSVVNKKRVYIILDVDIGDLFYYSTLLLEQLLISLPYDFRKKVGFTTYSGNPSAAKYINIMFIDKLNTTVNRQELSYGYLFDFYRGDFPRIDHASINKGFIKFVYENNKNTEINEEYFAYVEKFLKDKDEMLRLSIDSYDRLIELYELYQIVKCQYTSSRELRLKEALDKLITLAQGCGDFDIEFRKYINKYLYEGNENDKEILLSCFNKQIISFNRPEALLQFICNWSTVSDNILKEEIILNELKSKILSSIGMSLDTLDHWIYIRNHNNNYVNYTIDEEINRIDTEAYKNVISTISIENANTEQIKALENLTKLIKVDVNSNNKLEGLLTLKKLLELQDWTNQLTVGYQLLLRAEEGHRIKIIERLKEFVVQCKSNEEFSLILLCFADYAYADDKAMIITDYEAMLYFVYCKAGNIGLVNFLCWAAENKKLKKCFLKPSIVPYLNGEKAKLMDFKEFKRRLFNKKNNNLYKEIYKEYQSEQRNREKNRTEKNKNIDAEKKSRILLKRLIIILSIFLIAAFALAFFRFKSRINSISNGGNKVDTVAKRAQSDKY